MCNSFCYLHERVTKLPKVYSWQKFPTICSIIQWNKLWYNSPVVILENELFLSKGQSSRITKKCIPGKSLPLYVVLFTL